MAKKLLVTAASLLLLLGGLAAVKMLQFQTMSAQAASGGPPPETVGVSDATATSWQPSLDSVGTITAVQGVTLSAEVPGTIKRIAFESGTLVKGGDVLVELDSATERAQLQAAEANADLARTNLESGRSLVQGGAIATTQFKTLEAQAKQAEAELARLRSIIAKKVIRAPFAGRTGLRQINVGQFVGVGDPIVSLQSPDPVYVDFALPQQRLSQLAVGHAVQVETDAFPGHAYEGKLTAIQPQVDESTRNVPLRATLQNSKHELRPGMFVKVEVLLPRSERVVVVPTTAILYAPYGDSVFVVEEQKQEAGERAAPGGLVAKQKLVRLGTTRGDFVAIEKGLKPGDRVVVTGAFKLRNGAAVRINNELLPDASETPDPDDT